MSEAACRVEVDGADVRLHSPFFTFALDTAGVLRARWIQNHLTGRSIDLDGPEVEADVDAAHQRLWIGGWRACDTEHGAADADAESGYRAGFHRPDLDDSAWAARMTPVPNLHDAFWREGPDGCGWARTRVFVPQDCQGQALSLVLGGFGLYDFRYLRCFINGVDLGLRRADQRWNGPAVFELTGTGRPPGLIRFGEENVIALQLMDLFVRPGELDDVDPDRTVALPTRRCWPALFEQHILAGRSVDTARFQCRGHRVKRQGEAAEIAFEVASAELGLEATLRYAWNGRDPVLRKTVEVCRVGATPARVMHVRLGSYDTSVDVSDGEQGFPVYVGQEVFLGLAHPAGWAIGQANRVVLRQYPGRLLCPGATLRCMEVVCGVGADGAARQAFLAHLRGRMRRSVRGHDKPLAIFEPFGGWPIPEGRFLEAAEREDVVLDSISRVAESQRRTGMQFDYYSLDFWHDPAGDLIRADPGRFPRGLAPVREAVAAAGMQLGLWIDSCILHDWSIGQNPAVAPTVNHDRDYGPNDASAMCRATEPVRSLYTRAFLHHVRENRVRMVKFDNLQPVCCNTTHDHLPGVYSVEPVMDGVIEALNALDAECPDVFLMLYWGHRSPWWLLHADTLFEPGFAIEAAHPCASPTLYARDSVTVGLDRAQHWCRDVPAMGKDSLGVWLSSWGWNCSIGKERWAEAMAMDLCRGSLLAQLWSDAEWLTPAEHEQVARFIALLRTRPECFADSRPILGSPWRDEPYGYCCTDGERAFIAVNNCTWSDARVQLELNESWGLQGGGPWELFRWHPDPARLSAPGGAFGSRTQLVLRPFEVLLLEAVPQGLRPGLNRPLPQEPLAMDIAEPSRPVEITVTRAPGAACEGVGDAPEAGPSPGRRLRLAGLVPPARNGGVLAVCLEMKRGRQADMVADVGRRFSLAGTVAGYGAAARPVLGRDTFVCPWQAWRIAVRPSAQAQDFELFVTAAVDDEVRLVVTGHFVPVG